MRKVVAAINMTLDGYCDHTAGVPDKEIHDHYSRLLESSGVILYGRITYQLMQYWQTLLLNPSAEQSMNDFAKAIDRIPKIVFSSSLTSTGWDTAELSDLDLAQKVSKLKQQAGNNILIGSRSLIIQLLNQNLVDEFQLLVHPVAEGRGLALFEKIKERTIFKLVRTRTFGCGAIALYYAPEKIE